ncbi:MAG TPA: hypothetical protein PK971_15700, partial [Saprospiraceae bacterium]|nr:hypothetical protein [Saprospiraceae bacterium]
SFPLLLRRVGQVKRAKWTLGLLLGYLLLTGALGWKTFPIGNVLYNFGLGAVVLERSDIDDPLLLHIPKVPFFFVRLLVLAFTLWLAYQLWATDWRRLGLRARLFIALTLVFGAVYWAFTCLNWLIFDRYVLVLLPFVMMSLLLPHTPDEAGGVEGNFPSRSHLAALAVLALFSIVGTRDYLSWNRARYAGLARLEAQGLRPEEIGGGFEYNGWHRAGPRSSRAWSEKAWWFKGDSEWMVSMHALYGYDLGFAIPYTRWLPPRTDSIWFNRRKPAALSEAMICDMERISPDSSHFLPLSGTWLPGNGKCRAAGRSFSGQWASRLQKGCAFGATTVVDTLRLYDRFLIQVWRYPARSDAGIVLAADNGDLFWAIENSYSTRPDSAGWRLLTLEATVPEKAAGQRGKFFLWNASERDTVWFDDLKAWRWKSQQPF